MCFRQWILIGLALLTAFSTVAQSSELKWLDIELANYEYPYPVKKLTLYNQQQTLEMAYMDIQPAQYKGQNILLLHGKNFNGAYWKTTADALIANGVRVIIPDQIGFGKSSKPLHYQYTFQQLASNVKALLDSLGISQTAVLGHSMGGMLATRFALMYPETAVQLILENPIGLEDWKLKVPYQSVDDWYQAELKKTAAGIKKYQLESYYDNQWKPEYQQWVDLLAGWTLNAQYPLIAWNAALTYDMIFTQPVLYEFGEIHCPTLLIIGTRDRTALGKNLVDEATRKTMGHYELLGKQTSKAIPHAELVEIPNTGHLPHIERFDQFIQPLLNFLKASSN